VAAQLAASEEGLSSLSKQVSIIPNLDTKMLYRVNVLCIEF
jgi:hypothetical protein